jgi:hypothetical protein
MIPFEVPKTIDAETAIQVGTPKFRLPTSEKACPFSFFSFVHRTTSQGGDGVSRSAESGGAMLLIDACLEEPLRKGEEARGRERAALEIRDWKRLSNGRKDGLGLSRPCRDANEGSMLLPAGDDMKEPCIGVRIY